MKTSAATAASAANAANAATTAAAKAAAKAPGQRPAGRLPPVVAALRWRTLKRQFDQRSLRERLLLIAASVGLVLMLADALWLAPALADFKAARQQRGAAQLALNSLQDSLPQVQARETALAQARASELTLWRQRVRDGDSQLREHESALVGSERMVELLEQMLARHGDVRVRAMRSLGRSDLLASAAPGQATALAPASPAATTAAGNTATAAGVTTPTLYRHGVELELEGGFNALLAYLQAMEALPQRVLWGSVGFKVQQHPRSVLTLRVYTLSRDKHWLEI